MPPCPTGRGGIRASGRLVGDRARPRPWSWTWSWCVVVEASAPCTLPERALADLLRAGRATARRRAVAGMPYAAARLGSGSDVLGLDDDDVARPRLGPAAQPARPGRPRRRRSTRTWASGCPSRSPGCRPGSRRRGTRSCATACRSRRPATSPCRASASTPPTTSRVGDWLSLTGRPSSRSPPARSSSTDAGELRGIRRRLEWYPDDVWRHVVATDWARLGAGAAVRRARPASAVTTSARGWSRRGWRGSPCTSATCSSGAGRPTPSGSARASPGCRGRAPRSGRCEAALAATDWREREAGARRGAAPAAPAAGRGRAPDGRGPGRAVLGPALPRGARGGRRRGRGRASTDPAVRALPRGVGSRRAVERQRRRAAPADGAPDRVADDPASGGVITPPDAGPSAARVR